MTPSIIHKIYLNWKHSSVRTRLSTLGLLFVLCCGFTSANFPQPGDKADWEHHSADASDHLTLSHNSPDPNSDLHLTARKQIKVKCVKKSSPDPLRAFRSSTAGGTDPLSITGLVSVTRPAYYIFLFRFTLF